MNIYPSKYGNNPKFPTTQDFHVVESGEVLGRGVISKKEFQVGEIIAEITGDVISEIKLHTLQITPKEHLYDPYFSGLLLHSCDPNVSVDMLLRTITALKLIKEGDYITMDYTSTEDVLYNEFKCECGSQNCRGWISGKIDALPF